MRITLFVFCFMSVSPFTGLRAQGSSCGALGSGLRPLEDVEYGYINRGNRCEGIYAADVGAKRIELVSLTIGEIQYDLKNGENLNVSAYGEKVLVHVVGTTKVAGSYYRMDADADVDDPQDIWKFKWPIKDVLKPLNIDASRLGVVAWLKTKDGAPANYPKIYQPVRISSGDFRRTDAQPVILVALRFGSEVGIVKWRSAPLHDDVCLSYTPWASIPKTAIVGNLTDIKLRDLIGEQCVDFAAKPKDSNEWMPILSLRILMPPR